MHDNQNALKVTNYELAKDFFAKALAPIGVTLQLEHEGLAAFGSDGNLDLWLATHDEVEKPMFIVFAARDRNEVRAFYQAAIAAGGKDHRAPADNKLLHPNYYCASAVGPDGHNIEVFCLVPESAC